jgi:hypothetical protein
LLCAKKKKKKKKFFKVAFLFLSEFFRSPSSYFANFRILNLYLLADVNIVLPVVLASTILLCLAFSVLQGYV